MVILTTIENDYSKGLILTDKNGNPVKSPSESKKGDIHRALVKLIGYSNETNIRNINKYSMTYFDVVDWDEKSYRLVEVISPV